MTQNETTPAATGAVEALELMERIQQSTKGEMREVTKTDLEKAFIAGMRIAAGLTPEENA